MLADICGSLECSEENKANAYRVEPSASSLFVGDAMRSRCDDHVNKFLLLRGLSVAGLFVACHRAMGRRQASDDSVYDANAQEEESGCRADGTEEVELGQETGQL